MYNVLSLCSGLCFMKTPYESNFFKTNVNLNIDSMKINKASYDNNTHKYVCNVSITLKNGKLVDMVMLLDDLVTRYFVYLQPYDKLSVYQLCFLGNYEQKNPNIGENFTKKQCIKTMQEDIKNITVGEVYDGKGKCKYSVQIQYKNGSQCTRLIDGNELAEMYLDCLISKKNPLILDKPYQESQSDSESGESSDSSEEQADCTCSFF